MSHRPSFSLQGNISCHSPLRGKIWALKTELKMLGWHSRLTISRGKGPGAEWVRGPCPGLCTGEKARGAFWKTVLTPH